MYEDLTQNYDPEIYEEYLIHNNTIPMPPGAFIPNNHDATLPSLFSFLPSLPFLPCLPLLSLPFSLSCPFFPSFLPLEVGPLNLLSPGLEKPRILEKVFRFLRFFRF